MSRYTPRQVDTATFIASNATRIASVLGRLRAHARRCRTEKGYVVLPDTNRSTCRDAIGGAARRLSERTQLRLSVTWWLERAEAMLATLDKLNGGART